MTLSASRSQVALFLQFLPIYIFLPSVFHAYCGYRAEEQMFKCASAAVVTAWPAWRARAGEQRQPYSPYSIAPVEWLSCPDPTLLQLLPGAEADGAGPLQGLAQVGQEHEMERQLALTSVIYSMSLRALVMTVPKKRPRCTPLAAAPRETVLSRASPRPFPCSAKAPGLAVSYYGLTSDAPLREALLRMRADEVRSITETRGRLMTGSDCHLGVLQ